MSRVDWLLEQRKHAAWINATKAGEKEWECPCCACERDRLLHYRASSKNALEVAVAERNTYMEQRSYLFEAMQIVSDCNPKIGQQVAEQAVKKIQAWGE